MLLFLLLSTTCTHRCRLALHGWQCMPRPVESCYCFLLPLSCSANYTTVLIPHQSLQEWLQQLRFTFASCKAPLWSSCKVQPNTSAAAGPDVTPLCMLLDSAQRSTAAH
jgi:hypothetical protein